MSFSATGGLTQSASDDFAVGIQSTPTSTLFAASASYLLTVTGDTTFTAQYRSGGGAGTATFATSTIIVQVF